MKNTALIAAVFAAFLTAFAPHPAQAGCLDPLCMVRDPMDSVAFPIPPMAHINPNLYGYADANPVRKIDPPGLDAIVIDNGPTTGNPFGHTAIAITGGGIFSFGNSTDPGSSVMDYLRQQSLLRETQLFIIKTTPAQDKAMLGYLRMFKKRNGVEAFPDNCASRTAFALNVGGVDLTDPLTGLSPLPFPASLQRSLVSGGYTSLTIPRYGQVPGGLESFNPVPR